MSTPNLDVMREKWNNLQRRHRRESFRFTLVCERLEKYERAQARFAEHEARVESALAETPIACYLRELMACEGVLAA